MIELSSNIKSYLLEHFGQHYLEQFHDYINRSQETYIRLSQLRFSKSDVINRLRNYGVELLPIDRLPDAFKVISGESVVGKTLDFILGAYYIQSLSSMLPALILSPTKNDKVLDLCAAPGSKTTQLAEMMNNKGTLIANEISVDRLKSLVFNIDKMNLVNVGVLQGKGELLSKSFGNYFDKILVDAPCSALGIVQKKSEVSKWWNEKKAEGLAEIQFKLLLSAIKSCKVGGEIVYSTCTLSLEENELVLDKILKKYPVELVDINLPVNSVEAFTRYKNEQLNKTISKARRILPWEINSEGFFIAKLKKVGELESDSKFIDKHKNEFLNSESTRIKKLLDILCDYYGVDRAHFSSYKFLIKNGDIYFVDNSFEISNPDLFVRVGSKFGLIDKNELIQLHTLAAQTFGEFFTKNVLELSSISELETYLKGGTIKRDVGSTGQKVVKWNDLIIGTASSSKEGIKSQFPRAFRTQTILLK